MKLYRYYRIDIKLYKSIVLIYNIINILGLCIITIYIMNDVFYVYNVYNEFINSIIEYPNYMSIILMFNYNKDEYINDKDKLICIDLINQLIEINKNIISIGIFE